MTLPPSYRDSDTCDVCWEPCGDPLFGGARWVRWRHKRKWGHTPVSIQEKIRRAREIDPDGHRRTLKQQAEWREANQPPNPFTD